MDDRDYRARHAKTGDKKPAPLPFDDGLVARWRTRLAENGPVSEADGLSMLADFGLVTPAMVKIASMHELEAALPELRFPLVLKTAEDHAHKSDVGGVRLNIDNAEEASAAYRDMAARLGPRALVMEMAPSGTELSPDAAA